MTRSVIAIAALINLLMANPVAAAEGDLDTSFGTGGQVTTAIGSGNDNASSVAIQSNGKIVAAGYSNNGSTTDFALVRYNTNGSLDTNFGSGGKVTTAVGDNTGARSVAIQSDGKIVVAGANYNGNSNEFALVRYNTNGSLDTSFGSDGKVLTDIGGNTDEANSVAIQSDGKIVAAGSAYNGSNIGFALVRYNTDGSLDTSFGSGGKVTTAIGSGGVARSVAIQSDGKIVAAGDAYTADYSSDFALVRYNMNGSLDTSFGTGGKVTTAIGSVEDHGESVAIQSDGKIVVAGHSYNGSNSDYLGCFSNNADSDFALVRYNTNGSLDTSFGSDGKVTTAIGICEFANSVAIQSDGKIVAAGKSNNGSTTDFALVRYNTNGTLDTNFGSGGKVTTAVGSGGSASSVAIQSDGNIVVAGDSRIGSNGDFAVARYVGTPPTPPAAPTPVPTLPLFGLGILVSLLGLFSLGRLKHQ